MREMARANRKRLLFVMVSGLVVMTAEIVGGLLANSLVLLADAAHYATDVLAVGIAFLALTLAMRPATLQKSFGYRRAEVLAALLNAAALWGISVFFVFEAWRRLEAPPEVGGKVVLLVGGFSLVANGALALVLARGSGHNLNMRAAYLHILSDVLGSAAALVAGAAVTFFGWRLADPVLTLFITLLILVFTWRLTKETLNILLQGTPDTVDMTELEHAIRDVAAVKEVHELHLWSLTTGTEVLSVHVVLDAPPQGDAVTHDIHEKLKARFNIDHVTVQVESPECPCTSARCHPGSPTARSA
ncbi:MAG: cobalt-zinc-cadmium efflux system protein [Thermoplasmata archaeon]|nr:cobalt-zinc-cadmium efflux system protein [Thermoplasmata archaeon]